MAQMSRNLRKRENNYIDKEYWENKRKDKEQRTIGDYDDKKNN